MLGRSFPRELQGTLCTMIGAPVLAGVDKPKRLRRPVEHKHAIGVSREMFVVLKKIHSRFKVRTEFTEGMVNPTAIAYWLVDLAQQTREKFCGYPTDQPPAEHFGECRAHRKQLSALCEMFIRGVADGGVCKPAVVAYWKQVADSRREWQRNRKQIYLLVRRIPAAEESWAEVWREVLGKVRGEAYVVFSMSGEVN